MVIVPRRRLRRPVFVGLILTAGTLAAAIVLAVTYAIFLSLIWLLTLVA